MVDQRQELLARHDGPARHGGAAGDSGTISQIKGMLRKHWLQKKRMKGQLVWECIMPCYMGLIIWLICNAFKDSDEKTKAIMCPFFMTFYTPHITFLSARFII